jgi:hypothetical protein
MFMNSYIYLWTDLMATALSSIHTYINTYIHAYIHTQDALTNGATNEGRANKKIVQNSHAMCDRNREKVVSRGRQQKGRELEQSELLEDYGDY